MLLDCSRTSYASAGVDFALRAAFRGSLSDRLPRRTTGPRPGGGRAVSARGLHPRRRRGWPLCSDSLSARRQATQSLPAAAKEARTMNEQRFPKGWDEQRVKQLIADLDARTDEEWIAA